MDATIEPRLVAAMMELVFDIGCRRASFVTRDDELVVMAATPDKSVLIRGSVPAVVLQHGGFSLLRDDFNLMRSPSRAQANVKFDGGEIASLTYGRRRSSSLATPFKGTRHPARSLPDTYDAKADVEPKKLYDVILKSLDSGCARFDVSEGRMSVNGVNMAGIRGKNAATISAAGTYEWEPVACVIRGCQHAKYLALHITDNGPLVILCTDAITLGVSLAHAD